MNYGYDYKIFINKLNEYKRLIKSNNTNSLKKVVKALDDTKDVLESVRHLTVEEQNIYFKFLSEALIISSFSNNS